MQQRSLVLAGMLAVALAFGMAVIGCDNGTTSGAGGGGADTAKTIAVTGIPADFSASVNAGSEIILCPVGTTTAIKSNAVAGNNLTKGTISGDTAAIPLLIPDGSGNNWTGTGAYDIFVIMHDDANTAYKAASVTFTSATTTVPFGKFTKGTVS
jgi:hypothetical protein